MKEDAGTEAIRRVAHSQVRVICLGGEGEIGAVSHEMK